MLVSGGTSAGGLAALFLTQRARGRVTKLIGRLPERVRARFPHGWGLGRLVGRAAARNADQ